MEFVDLDDDMNDPRHATREYLDLLDKLEKEHVEETTMSRHEETKDETDRGTVYYQISEQKELLAQLDNVVDILGNRIYTILVDEQPKEDDESVKDGISHPELVTNLMIHNGQLTSYIQRLNSIIERVRI